MALTIKNEETERLARELAVATGESITGSVTVAVRERLDRLSPGGESPMVRAERMVTLGRLVAASIAGRSIDADALYGDDGLPA